MVQLAHGSGERLRSAPVMPHVSHRITAKPQRGHKGDIGDFAEFTEAYQIERDFKAKVENRVQ